MNKKGLYAATLTIVVILISIVSYNIYLSGKEKDVALENIGLTAASTLNSFYEAERIKYFVNEAAKYAAINAISLMGENGGIYGTKDCTNIDVDKIKYVIWKENCEPNKNNDFKKYFSDVFDGYLNSINIKSEDFDLDISGNLNINGKAKEKLGINIGSVSNVDVKYKIKEGDGKGLGSGSERIQPYIMDIITKYSNQYDVSKSLVIAVIIQESNGDVNAVSEVGAAGLMQLMPNTAKSLGLRNTIYSCGVIGDYTSCECIAAKKDSCDYENDERFNPERNLYAGINYLRNLLDKYKNINLALAAYNWGPDNVNKNCDLDKDFSSCENVPAENNNYVKEVMERYELLNKGEIYSSIESFIWPVEGYNYISSCFGYRGVIVEEYTSVYHPGVDIPVPENTPVRVVADGVISLVNDEWGRIVVDHGNGILTEYLHLKSIIKKDGNVRQGEIIGYSGDKKSEGSYHLHFGVINTNIDPAKYNENEVVLTSFNERQYVNPNCYFNLEYTINPDSLSCQCSNNMCGLNEGPTKWCNYYGSTESKLKLEKIGSYYFKPEFLVDLDYNFDDYNKMKRVAENWINGNCVDNPEICVMNNYDMKETILVGGDLRVFEFKSKEKLNGIKEVVVRFALPIPK